MTQQVKNLSVNAGDVRDMGSMPGSERSPGGGNGNHSSILAWKIPWIEKPGELQSVGSQRVGHKWACTFPYWDVALSHYFTKHWFPSRVKTNTQFPRWPSSTLPIPHRAEYPPALWSWPPDCTPHYNLMILRYFFYSIFYSKSSKSCVFDICSTSQFGLSTFQVVTFV